MFGPIIDINSDGTAILDKRYVKLVPELYEVYKDKNLGSKMILYIVSVYDDKTPYRHLPYEIRREDVSRKLFGKKYNSRCKHPLVIKAIEVYKFIQYDPLKEEYNSIVNKHKEKLEIYDAMRVTEANFDRFNKNEALMAKSSESLEKLKERINAEEEENKIMGQDSGNLSFIEERLAILRKQQKT